MSSALITFQRTDRYLHLKVGILPSRTKPILAMLCTVSGSDFTPNAANYKPFTVPLLMKNETVSGVDPMLVYYCFAYKYHFVYIPMSSIISCKRDTRYSVPIPLSFDATSSVMRQMTFAYPNEKTMAYLEDTAAQKEFEANVKDYLSAFNLLN